MIEKSTLTLEVVVGNDNEMDIDDLTNALSDALSCLLSDMQMDDELGDCWRIEVHDADGLSFYSGRAGSGVGDDPHEPIDPMPLPGEADAQKDWLEATLSSSRKLLEDLPAEKKTALDNEAKFQDVVRSNEQAAIVGRGDDR